MIASSGTALANLSYLIGAVVLAFLGGMFVWFRNRKPETVEHNMATFRKSLDALAPEGRSSTAEPQPGAAAQFQVRRSPRATAESPAGASGDARGGEGG